MIEQMVTGYNLDGNTRRNELTPMPSEIPEELRIKFEAYKPLLLGLVETWIKDKEDTEEIVQDTYLRALKGYSMFRGESKIETWLYRIAKNLTTHRYLHNKRRGSHLKDNIDEMYGIASPDQSARIDLQEREFQEMYDEARLLISDKHREIIVLRTTLHMEYLEIAAHLGINVGTVKSRISRARESLLKKMEKLGTERDSLSIHDFMERECWALRPGFYQGATKIVL